MSGPPPENARLLFYVGIGAAILFVVTASLVVIVQTVAPIFGLTPGSPDPAILGSMLVWAAVALGFLPAAAILSRRSGGSE